MRSASQQHSSFYPLSNPQKWTLSHLPEEPGECSAAGILLSDCWRGKDSSRGAAPAGLWGTALTLSWGSSTSVLHIARSDSGKQFLPPPSTQKPISTCVAAWKRVQVVAWRAGRPFRREERAGCWVQVGSCGCLVVLSSRNALAAVRKMSGICVKSLLFWGLLEFHSLQIPTGAEGGGYRSSIPSFSSPGRSLIPHFGSKWELPHLKIYPTLPLKGLHFWERRSSSEASW